MDEYERVELPEDDSFDEDVVYVNQDEDVDDSEEDELTGAKEETLDVARHRMQNADREAIAASASQAAQQSYGAPARMDDFVSRYLQRSKLNATLEQFQTELYEMRQRGAIPVEAELAPPVYQENARLISRVCALEAETERWKEVAAKTRDTYDQLRGQRDFHRMHHRRVAQEKDKILGEMDWLRKRHAPLEPQMERLRNKLDKVERERMLLAVDKDKHSLRFEGLKDTVSQLEKAHGQKKVEPVKQKKAVSKPVVEDTRMPIEDRPNPFAAVAFDPTPVTHFQTLQVGQGHTLAVTSVALHPTKPVVATASDDTTWKMWTLPGAELIMTGEGHKDWVSSVDFHPCGALLATGSGDATVKLWDFAASACAATLTDHGQAVWDVSFHDTGHFLVSCSMDHTSKVWDIETQKCRMTLRGHVGSVNSCCFQPCTNVLATCSGDKTVSLWDVRTGLCALTFYGHSNACNGVAFALDGLSVVSSDADGSAKVWDLRTKSERAHVRAGPYAANKCTFDRSCKIIAVGSDDGTCKVFDVDAGKHVRDLAGHEDAVHDVVFDSLGKWMITSSGDKTFRVWSG